MYCALLVMVPLLCRRQSSYLFRRLCRGGGGGDRGATATAKGLTPFNTNTGISVPLLRVRPNTSADAARDYLPQWREEGRRRCVSRRLRLADNFARERETLIEIYYCVRLYRGDNDFRHVL